MRFPHFLDQHGPFAGRSRLFSILPVAALPLLQVAFSYKVKTSCTLNGNIGFDCGTGLIRVVFAFYGSKNATAVARDQCVHQLGDCTVDDLDDASANCNGQSTCLLRLEAVYLHRCQADSNYLQLGYECIPAAMSVNICDKVSRAVTSGFLMSPLFPTQYYPANQNCRCFLSIPEPNSSIAFYVEEFQLHSDCQHDHFKISEMENASETYCSHQYAGTQILKRSRQTSVTFRSNAVSSNRGFWIQFESVKACPKNWDSLSGKCVKALNETKTWNEAKRDCRAQGASLLTPDDPVYSTRMALYLIQKGLLSLWIDLQRQKLPDGEWSWLWMDRGVPLEEKGWIPWQQGRPDASSGDCAVTQHQAQRNKFRQVFEWSNTDCEQRRPYVCQMDSALSTEPRTFASLSPRRRRQEVQSIPSSDYITVQCSPVEETTTQTAITTMTTTTTTTTTSATRAHSTAAASVASTLLPSLRSEAGLKEQHAAPQRQEWFTGAVIGSVLGVVLLLVAAQLVIIWRCRKQKKLINYQSSTVSTVSSQGSPYWHRQSTRSLTSGFNPNASYSAPEYEYMPQEQGANNRKQLTVINEQEPQPRPAPEKGTSYDRMDHFPRHTLPPDHVYEAIPCCTSQDGRVYDKLNFHPRTAPIDSSQPPMLPKRPDSYDSSQHHSSSSSNLTESTNMYDHMPPQENHALHKEFLRFIHKEVPILYQKWDI